MLSLFFQIHNSTKRTVVLSSVNLMSTGRYRCEVLGEGPFFPTVSDHSDMEVIGKEHQSRFVLIKSFIFQRNRAITTIQPPQTWRYCYVVDLYPRRRSASLLLGRFSLSERMLLLSRSRPRKKERKKIVLTNRNFIHVRGKIKS